MEFSSSMCCFMGCALVLYLRNTYLNQGHKDLPCFCLPCFITSGFTLRSMIHFDLIFVYSARYTWSSFAYIYISNWASIIFLTDYLFFQWITFVLALKFSCPYLLDFFWLFYSTDLFLSLDTSLLHCFDYFSSAMNCDVRQY